MTSFKPGDSVRIDDIIPATVMDEGIKYVGRILNGGVDPGVYRDPYWVCVKHDGIEEFISSKRLELTDQKEHLKREEENKITENDYGFLCKLPDTKFWELDRVLVKYPFGMTPRKAVVIEINWYSMKGNGPRTYRVTKIERNDWYVQCWNQSSEVFETNLELITKGNVWNHYNGGTPIYRSLKEEAATNILMGLVSWVKNPAGEDGDDYLWTQDQIFEASKIGLVDSGDLTDPPSKNGATTKAVIYNDGVLGKKMRSITSSGFY